MTLYYQDDFVTLYLGDCLQAAELWPVDGTMVTDPPYGMKHRSGMGGKHGDCEIRGDADTTVRDAALQKWRPLPALILGRWSVPRPAGTKMVLTWEKGEHVGMGDLSLPWKPNTEEIYVLGSGFAGRRTGSVLRHLAVAGCVGIDRGNRVHPTEKPVGLMCELIGKCPAGVIFDPFAGSGTTLRAAKDLSRRAVGFELVEEYCAAAAERLAQECLPGVNNPPPTAAEAAT